jgi:hypothetical protein
VKNTLKNALFMSIRHFPVTLGCLVVAIIIALLVYYVPMMVPFCFILVFSTAAYVCSLMFVRVFDNYIPPAESEADAGTEDANGSEETTEGNKATTAADPVKEESGDNNT